MSQPGEVWMKNPGRCPSHLMGTGKRVVVRLRNGTEQGRQPVNADTKAGWPAWGDRGSQRTDWSLTGSPFDILEYLEL